MAETCVLIHQVEVWGQALMAAEPQRSKSEPQDVLGEAWPGGFAA